jgi:hypothetical protein
MTAGGSHLLRAIILGVGLAWAGAALRGANDAGGNGYAEPSVESHLVAVVTIENAAMLDATGKPYDPPVDGPGIKYHSTLYRLLAHTYVEQGRKITFKTDAISEAKYWRAIQQFPHFPFGFYALALTLRNRRDPTWRDFAQQAIVIFTRTTAMAGCNPGHFAALRELKGYLAEASP